MTTAALVALTLYGAAGASSAAAQDVSFRTDTLAPGVFALVRPVSPDLVAISNHLVILDDDGVTLVDTGLTPDVARGVVAEIRRLTDRPVRWIVNTHWHDDHVWGNGVVTEAFPDARIVAHPFAMPFLRDSLPAALDRNRTEYPDALRRFENALRTGRTSLGEPVTDAMRDAFEAQAGMLRWFIPAMDEMEMTLPEAGVADALILRRPGREIHIRHLGRGNTGGDLVVHLPREGIVATGDLTVRPVPYGFGSFLGDWVGTLDRVLALGAEVIVPGHGEPMRDAGYVRQLQDLIRFTLSETRAAVERGLDLEGARTAIDFSEMEQRFTGGDPVLLRGFDAYWRQPAVERAYLEVTTERTGR